MCELNGEQIPYFILSSRKPVENEDRVLMEDDFHLRNGSRQVEFLLSNGISFGRHNVIVVSVTEE